MLLGALPFLGDFVPAAACSLCVRRARSTGAVDKTLVGKLAASEELFSEVARVQSAGSGVNGFGDQLDIGGKAQQRSNKILSCAVLAC